MHNEPNFFGRKHSQNDLTLQATKTPPGLKRALNPNTRPRRSSLYDNKKTHHVRRNREWVCRSSQQSLNPTSVLSPPASCPCTP
jgi:hypothetical protein